MQGKSLGNVCLNVRFVTSVVAAFAPNFARFYPAFAMIVSSIISHVTAVLGRCTTSCMLPVMSKPDSVQDGGQDRASGTIIHQCYVIHIYPFSK